MLDINPVDCFGYYPQAGNPICRTCGVFAECLEHWFHCPSTIIDNNDPEAARMPKPRLDAERDEAKP